MIRQRAHNKQAHHYQYTDQPGKCYNPYKNSSHSMIYTLVFKTFVCFNVLGSCAISSLQERVCSFPALK